MDSLPEINLNLNTATDTAKKTAKHAASSLKAAGNLVAKKAERTKLVTVTLPRAYAELGKSVYKDGSRRDEFADLFQSVDKLLAERKRLADEGKARPSGTTVTDKAKKVAADAADMAKAKAVDLQAFQAFAKLGEAVFQQHGESAGAADTVEPIAKAIARRDQLDREVGAINESAKGKWITPKRIVLGFGVLVGLAVLGNLANSEKDGGSGSSGSHTASDKNRKETQAAKKGGLKLPNPKGVSETERTAYIEGWQQAHKDGLHWARELDKGIKENENQLVLKAYYDSISQLSSHYGELLEKSVENVENQERLTGRRCEGNSDLIQARGWATGAWDGLKASAGKYMR